MVNELIDWIMMDLDSAKIKKACEHLRINIMEAYNIDRQDFLNKTFLEMLLDEFNEIRNTLYRQMDIESTMPEHQFCGEYYPCDTWIEAEIDLNTAIDNIDELMQLL